MFKVFAQWGGQSIPSHPLFTNQGRVKADKMKASRYFTELMFYGLLIPFLIRN